MNKISGYYEFGDFRLDRQARVLYRAGTLVALKPKAVETLLALVENAGEVVSKDDLMLRVWREVSVAENSLSVNIYALRKMFAEFGEGRDYIQTVPRRGFRFAPPVTISFEEPSVPISSPEKDEIVDLENISSPMQEATAETSKSEAISANDQNRVSPAAPPSFLYKSFLAAVLLAVLLVASGSYYAWFDRRPEAEKSSADLPPQNGIAERETVSSEARELYLRGYRLWQTRDSGQMRQGADSFARAVQLDPNFVAAYLGLADSYAMIDNNPAQWRMAEEYADQALILAPNSADAHASKGFILAFNKWQWQEAEREFTRALELDDHSGKAHQWYAAWLTVNRRFAEAETHLKRAIEIYPASPNYNADLAELYYRRKDFAAAEQQCRRLNELTAETPVMVACGEFGVLLAQKRLDEAARSRFQGLLNSGRTLEQVKNSDEYRAYKAGGWRGWLEKSIGDYEDEPTAYNASYHLSARYALVGDRENALRMLERAYEGRVFLLPFANVSAEFDELRDEPRFRELMRRVGLNS